MRWRALPGICCAVELGRRLSRLAIIGDRLQLLDQRSHRIGGRAECRPHLSDGQIFWQIRVRALHQFVEGQRAGSLLGGPARGGLEQFNDQASVVFV